MKFLIAFAVIAVAFATEEIRVVQLPPAPAPEVASPDYLPLIAPASLFDVPTPNEQADVVIVKAEPVIVADSPAPVEDVQIVHIAYNVVDAPEASAGDVHIERAEPIIISEVLAGENIEPVAEVAEVQNAEAPIESVKVATPVVDNGAPIIIDNVRVFNPSMPIRYADPTLR